jgi:regulator of sigma E protease
MLLTIGAFLVVLGVLVFIHELGHFVAAKAAGIMVHRFSLGIGSPIPWLTHRWGETEYSISWLPLGGYVKMATSEADATSSALEGQTLEEEAPVDRRFESKPVWQRMIVILAGVTMNVLFAWAAFTFLAIHNGRQIDPTTVIGRVSADSLPASSAGLESVRPGTRVLAVNGKPVVTWDEIVSGIAETPGDSLVLTFDSVPPLTLAIPATAMEDRVRVALALAPWRPAIIGQVLPGYPGERAGLSVGDTVLAIDGAPVVQWYDLLDQVRPAAGRALVLSLGTAKGRREVAVTPRGESEAGPDGVKHEVGKIGIGVAMVAHSEPYTIPAAIAEGALETLSASTQIVRSVRGLVAGHIDRRNVGGPILIAQVAGQQARQGGNEFLAFMALVSVNLAVLNLLPIPVLDGGQFVFLLAEAIRRKPLSLRLRERLTLVGLALITALMVFAFWNDIVRNWASIVGFVRSLGGGG